MLSRASAGTRRSPSATSAQKSNNVWNSQSTLSARSLASPCWTAPSSWCARCSRGRTRVIPSVRARCSSREAVETQVLWPRTQCCGHGLRENDQARVRGPGIRRSERFWTVGGIVTFDRDRASEQYRSNVWQRTWKGDEYMASLPDKQPMRPPFTLESLSLDVIDLDLRNSRFPRDAQSQIDAFELMLSTAGDECLDLLKDMTRTGQMNSSDLPIVVASGGRYLMMEGNRRLTCLKLWNDPGLIENEALANQYSTRIERLVADSAYAAPTALRVAVAPDESDADVWIERKHTGGAGGAGAVEWGAAMKDRRRARNDPSKASRSMAFVELVSSEYENEPDILKSLEAVRTARYTFIQRFVDRSVVRELIGLDFSAGKMSFRHGAKASKPIIRQILGDFARPKAESGKTWARELDTVEDFRDYLNKYGRLLPGASSNLGEAKNTGTTSGGPSTTGAVSGSDGEESPQPAGAQSTNSNDGSQTEYEDSRPPRPSPPRENIFRGLALSNFTSRIQEMVRQTSHLNVQRQNETVSVMLRVILDLTAYQFLKSHGQDVPKDLDKRIRAAIKIIDPHASDALGTAEATSSLCKAFHSTTADSVRLVQYAVHDIHSGRTPAEVLTLSDRYTPVLQEMNDNMGNHPVR